MRRPLFSSIIFVIVLSVFINSLNGQDHRQKEELESFFQNYSKWTKHQREVDNEIDSSTVNLNWGLKQEEILYWASTERTTFHNAFVKCKQMGMEPVTVLTRDQNDKLERFFQPLLNKDDSYPGFWMFAQKIKDNNFYWLNTGSPLKFTKWFGNYPDNWGGNENCLSMLFSTTAGVGWNDIACDKEQRFVCQRRKSSVAFIMDIDKGLF